MLSLFQKMAQDYTVTTYDLPKKDSSPMPIIIGVIIAIIVIGGTWKVFTKAKRPGWAALIPIYNTYILLKIVNKPWWWLLLMLIPIVNFIVLIIVMHRLSKVFGFGVGMTLLLLFFPYIGFPVLGFGSSTYKPAVVK